MSKRCMTLVSCPYEQHCAHRQVPHSAANLFFQPQHVGEHCSNYKLHVEPKDEDMTRLAGALA